MHRELFSLHLPNHSRIEANFEDLAVFHAGLVEGLPPYLDQFDSCRFSGPSELGSDAGND